MFRLLVAVGMIMFGTIATAHEMTPTYPKLKSSFMDGVTVTTMRMFNKRKDVEYYEIGVFDEDFNPVPFVTAYRVIKIQYLGHVMFDVYIADRDKYRARYICSRSKLRKDTRIATNVTSRICSKIK